MAKVERAEIDLYCSCCGKVYTYPVSKVWIRVIHHRTGSISVEFNIPEIPLCWECMKK